jgi:hypothetical protein
MISGFPPSINMVNNSKFSKAFVRASEQHKITAIAVPFENESHVITPRSWNGMRLWVMTQEE